MSDSIKHDGVLAIDPSIKSCGIAIYDRNKLVYCNVIRSSGATHTLTNIKEIMQKCQEAWEKTMGVTFSPEILVVEKPQIYQQQHLKGDPNDLVPLAIMAGIFWERFKPKSVLFPLPKEWKGQVPKEVMTKRTISLLDKREANVLLDDMVRVPDGLRHNGYDAVGLGLWALDRLGKRKIST